MIDYIVKYQNSYVYSHLFEHNLVDLLNKNVTMTGIFSSKVFNHPFDYDEWPTTNANTDKQLEPYNMSIFKLRYEYPAIFTKIWRSDHKSQQLEMEGKFNTNEQKVFKIKYNLNILSSVSEENGQLMEAIAASEELSIFTTDLVMDLIDFKWERFAFRQHMFGAFIHFIYVMVLIYYINFTFLVQKATYKNLDTGVISDTKQGCEGDCERISPITDLTYLYIIFCCLLYPLIYDGTQALKQGSQYLADPWNYMDMMHITLGYYNIYCQINVGTWELTSKIVMIFVTIVCLIKTFFFMRIVKSFSYIVTMIINVIMDLKVFMLFFLILIIMFSMIFDVIAPNPAKEYDYVGLYWGNVLTTLRLSLGDFDFGVLE